MKNNIIRKITIGKDYKNDSMHYAVNQEVYGGHEICDIIEEEDKYCIYIKKEDIVLPNCSHFSEKQLDLRSFVQRSAVHPLFSKEFTTQ